MGIERKSKARLIALIIASLLFSTGSLADPPGYSRLEEQTRREVFIKKAELGTLDCSLEVRQRGKEIKDTDNWEMGKWKTHGTAECIDAMLKAKKFKEAKAAIEMTEGVQNWGALVLVSLRNVPAYATDDKCNAGEMKYEGTELEELLVTIMKRINVNDTEKGRLRQDPNTSWFISGMFAHIKTPLCFDKPRLIKLIHLMHDHGLKTKFWGEEEYGGTVFSSVMWLGDISLAKRILDGGIRANRQNWVYLFARAPNMEMVRLLEDHGYQLKKAEYRKIFQLNKKFPDYFLQKGTEPAVIEYYQSKLN